MSVDRGIIVAPVTIDDVKQVLGESTNDLAALCRSSNINMMSKYKPVPLAETFVTDSLNADMRTWTAKSDTGWWIGNPNGVFGMRTVMMCSKPKNLADGHTISLQELQKLLIVCQTSLVITVTRTKATFLFEQLCTDIARTMWCMMTMLFAYCFRVVMILFIRIILSRWVIC